jgi:integrase
MFSDEEYSRLVKTAKGHNRIRLYYIIRVLASSGIRIGELQYLTKDTLKTGGTFVKGKTKIREILISNALCMELLEYCEREHITSVIFHGRNKDRLIDKARIWRELKELAELAGIPAEKVHAHNFRHYFAKKYLSSYHDLVDLADILGHNSIETTRIYTRTSGQEKRSRINDLGL